MLLCYSYCGVIWPVFAGPLLGLLHTFLSLDYSDPTLSLGLHSCYLGFLDLFYCLQASLAHFFLPGHPQPILIPHSHGFFLTLLSFSSPITIFFTFGVYRLSINPLLTYFITSSLLRPILAFILPMGLLLLSLDSFRPACFFWGPFIIFWAYDPLFLPFGFNGFFPNLLTLFCSYCWASSCYWAFLPKWASTLPNIAEQYTNLKIPTKIYQQRIF